MDQVFIKRCFDLARLGVGGAAPNPTVGAVLVHDGRIIGEGFHERYGGDHAEVQCINSVKANDHSLIKDAVLYVSLEPCCVVGNTPACTDLIQKYGIQNVVYSTVDPSPAVDGKSEMILIKNGSSVTKDVYKESGDLIIQPRNVWASKKRPYIILKFAQSKDGFIGQEERQVWLSNAYTKVLSHKWRSEADAIMVGTNTAALDNPKLNTRHYHGTSPLRIVLDKTLRLERDLNLFDNSLTTWVICNDKKNRANKERLKYIELPFDDNLLPSVLQHLFMANKGILLVEGGAHLLQSFIDLDLWDEARVFRTNKILGSGIVAPQLKNKPIQTLYLKDNQLEVHTNP